MTFLLPAHCLGSLAGIITVLNGKTHCKWQFSLAMLNYQRVTTQTRSAYDSAASRPDSVPNFLLTVLDVGVGSGDFCVWILSTFYNLSLSPNVGWPHMDQNGKSNEKKQNLYLINLKIPLSKDSAIFIPQFRFIIQEISRDLRDLQISSPLAPWFPCVFAAPLPSAPVPAPRSAPWRRPPALWRRVLQRRGRPRARPHAVPGGWTMVER